MAKYLFPNINTMAGLNLNALKNISIPLEKISEPLESSMPEITTPRIEINEAPKMQRISLTKLRLNTTENKTVEPAASIEAKITEPVIEKMRLFPKAENVPHTVEANLPIVAEIIDTVEVPVDTPVVAEILPAEIPVASAEITSIFNNSEIIEPIVSSDTHLDAVIEEKELFPGLHLLEDFDFSDSNIGKLEDESTKDLPPTPPIESAATSVFTPETIEIVADIDTNETIPSAIAIEDLRES